MGRCGLIWLFLLFWMAGAVEALAFSKPTENSEIDPNLFRIDQEKYLGVRFGTELTLLDETGAALPFDQFPNRPFILVPAYYTCDGSCFTVGGALRSLLKDVKALQAVDDYNVLFVSFDKNDSIKTIDSFRKYLSLSKDQTPGWYVTVFQNPELIQPEMAKFGYKFFWSPRDKTFFHPTVILIMNAEGRVHRYLNVLNATAKDLELALLEAKSNQFRPSETLDYLVSLCYSYNYKEGRYTVNIPVFIGAGSFVLGIGLLLGSLGIYRLIHRRKNTRQ
jgi:protein SCO1/2